MDEPVRRRSFVRLVATGAVQNAGRLAALSGVAAGMVAQGVASLAEATSDAAGCLGRSLPHVAADRASSAAPASVPRPLQRGPRPWTRPRCATLTTSATCCWWSTGPGRAVPQPISVPAAAMASCASRRAASSAMAQHVRRDGHVTLLLDEPATGQRLMVFGTARLLEGAECARPKPRRVDHGAPAADHRARRHRGPAQPRHPDAPVTNAAGGLLFEDVRLIDGIARGRATARGRAGHRRPHRCHRGCRSGRPAQAARGRIGSGASDIQRGPGRWPDAAAGAHRLPRPLPARCARRRCLRHRRAQESDARLSLRAARGAAEALAAGVTTATQRRCAACAGHPALRPPSRPATCPGPDYIPAGLALTITGGHGWRFGIEADGELALRAAVRANVRDGARVIKAVASEAAMLTSECGGRPGADRGRAAGDRGRGGPPSLPGPGACPGQ